MRRPLIGIMTSFAGSLLLSMALLVVGAAVAFLLSGGRMGDALFGSFHLVHLDPAPEERLRGLLADAQLELAAHEPTLVHEEGGYGLRLFVDDSRPTPYARLRELTARHGFTSQRFTTGPRFPLTLMALADDPASMLGLSTLGWILLPTPLAFLFVGWRARRRHVVAGAPCVAAGRGLLLGALAGAAAFGLASGLEAALAAFGLPVSEQPVVMALLEEGGAMRWGFILVAVLLAPLGEELFFRGFVFEVLNHRHGLLLGHLISGLLFAAVHVNPSGVPVYLLLAAIFAECYRRSGGLLVPVVGHAVVNAATVTLHLAAL